MAEKESLPMRFTGKWTGTEGMEYTESVIAGMSRGGFLDEDDETSEWDDEKPKPVWFIRRWYNGKRNWFGELRREENNLWEEDQEILDDIKATLSGHLREDFDAWIAAHRERVLGEH